MTEMRKQIILWVGVALQNVGIEKIWLAAVRATWLLRSNNPTFCILTTWHPKLCLGKAIDILGNMKKHSELFPLLQMAARNVRT